MLALPLYAEAPTSPISVGDRRSIDPSCSRCGLGALAERSRCVPPDAIAGRDGNQSAPLLIVGEGPGREEDRAGRPFVGVSGRALRSAVREMWAGPVVYDNATRCAAGKADITEAHIASCSPYLRQTLDEVRPDRIVALGSTAFRAVLGRAPPVYSVRGGYGWVRHENRDIPVWLVLHPAAGLRNRHIMAWWKDDMRRALQEQPPFGPAYEDELELVETPEDARRAVREIRAAAEWFGFDCETAGTPHTDYFEMLTLAVCPAGADRAYVWEREAFKRPEVVEPLRELMWDAKVGKSAHNFKFDANAVFYELGIEVRGMRADTHVWRKLDDAQALTGLEHVSELVGMGGAKEEMDHHVEKACAYIGKLRQKSQKQGFLRGVEDPAAEAAVRHRDDEPKRFAYALVPPGVRRRYCARDAVAATRVAEHLERRLKASPSWHIWKKVAQPAVSSIGQIERWGLAANVEGIDLFTRYIQAEQADALGRLRVYGDINFDSDPQVSHLLYERLKLPVLERSEKTKQPKTDKTVLARLRGQHPLVEDLIEYRRLTTLEERYGAPMRTFVRRDGRVHPSLKLDGTETGRLSCIDPPLHQLPRPEDGDGNEDGKMIRDMFVAEPGWTLLQADYGQIEYRVAAMLSGDPVMKAMFAAGEDFHMATARLVSQIFWGIKPEAVTKAQRSVVKAFNFGLLYGMTDGGLARRIGCSKAEAARLRAAIMGKWTVLAAWLRETLREARRTGEVWTYWAGQKARRRPLPNLGSKEDGQRINAENASINTPVQGTASDFTLASINELVPWIIENDIPARVVLTVHDSILFEVRNDAIGDVRDEAESIMKGWDSMGVPLAVDFEEGPSWGSLEKMAA